MSDNAKWVAFDVARSRLLMQIGELDRLIDQEQSAAEPDAAKIVALENELDALIDQSDMLSADDIELTSKIASGPRP
jgi:hypothetical protein